MKKTLYYPGFEIQDKNWLKFALLYLEGINTIIPEIGESFLSEEYRLIKNETNLLHKYSPQYSEARRATEIVIDIISKYIKNPIKKNGTLGEINIVDLWRQQNNQNYDLFETKFTYEFVLFCKEWGFYQQSNNGIKIPSQLATTYMAILAHSIGKKQNMSIITDIMHEEEIVSLSDDLFAFNKELEELNYIKKYLTLKLPVNLKNISFEKIIDFRNKEDFQKKLKAFHTALGELTSLSENSLTDLSFREITENVEWSLKELAAEIINFSSSFINTTLGIFLDYRGGVGGLDIINDLLGFIPTVGTGRQLYKNVSSSNRRLATKYLTDLQNINGSRKRSNLIAKFPII